MPDNQTEIFIIFFTSIFIGLLLAGFIIAVFHLNRKKRLIQEKELENIKTESEKNMLEARIDVQEEVLKNVAMEIHDNIGQMMLLININNSLIQSMPLPAEATELVKENRSMLGKTMADISQLSRSMHSDRITDLGAFETINHELELLNRKGVLKASFVNELQSEKEIRKMVHLVIFRMYQEIIKNIIKHAQASEVRCIVLHTAEGMRMEITDNGIGFDTTIMNSNGPNGIGLRSLRSRMEIIKGTLSVNSTPGIGTSITIFIPEKELYDHE